MKARFLIPIATALFFLSSCRKGPEDPLLSLQTRKARICTPWALTKADKKEVVTSRSNSFSNITVTNGLFSTDSLKVIQIYQGDTSVLRKGYSFECQFFKDNSYISNIKVHGQRADTLLLGADPVTNVDYKYIAVYDTTIYTGIYGSWDFTSGSNHKKKELVIIKDQTVSETVNTSLKYISLNGGPELKSIVRSYYSKTSSATASIREYEISGLYDDRLILTRILDSSYTKWVGETYPTSVRINGVERIEFKKR